MNVEIFGIDNFNIISDEQYYYVFRALNKDDQKEIEEGITAIDGKIQRVLTNKQRYAENDKYAESSEISLKEVWDHTKSVNYYKGTSCISLSSNANVSLDYGSRYGHKYLMVKIPKDNPTQIYNAGQYMISELNRILDKIIDELPENSEILLLLKEIEKKQQTVEIKELIGERFKSARTGGKFTSKANINTKETLMLRFNKRQAFSEEQQLEYVKLMAKLSTLELYGMVPKELLNNINIPSLTRTIGSEFSNREFVHYGELNSDEFVQISKINIDLFALLQIAEEQGVSKQEIKQIEARLIEYTNQGYDLIKKDGKLYYSNGENEIELNIDGENILINENILDDNFDMSIEEVFEKTNGSISFIKAKNATQFVYNLSIAQRKSIELTKVLKSIIRDEKLAPIIDEIAKKSIAINDKIITRKNSKGIQVSESVNIDMNRGVRKQFSDDEQKRIYKRVKDLSLEELNSIISNQGAELEQDIYINNLNHNDIDNKKSKDERLNRYYSETIVDMLDISKIYKNTIRDKELNEQEREELITRLEKVDCKRLVEAFKKAGIIETNVSGYIINLLASNGFQGHTLEELSRLENLDEIIEKNVRNTSLKGHVYPSVMEELRRIKDNENVVEGSQIKLRDYQQEAVDNADSIFAERKRFAGVVLPTGAGKSFVALTEMLKIKNGNILYIAPTHAILTQFQMHILKYVANVEVLSTKEIEELKKEQNKYNEKELKLPKGKILPIQANEYVKKEFPHLKLFCYQGLSSKNELELTDEQRVERDNEENELREILKNADADLIVLDELHRAGAKTWKKSIEQLITSNEKANILGITATPIRDADHVDMMLELAKMTDTYTQNELATKQYLAYEMYLIDAIQRGLVVEPKIVSFDFMLKYSDQYDEIIEMIESENDDKKKKALIDIKNKIDKFALGDIDISANISTKELEEIGKIIKETIKKQDGRYIVFLPQHSHDDGLSENEYFDKMEEIVRKMIGEVDAEPEISRLSSENSKSENHRAIMDFENSTSKHIKVMLAINMLNEGVHIIGTNGEIMFRKLNNGTTILYFQQLGRVIFAIDPNSPLKEEDIPMVYDIYNNYLMQSLNRTVNETTPKSDLQKLQEIVKWIDKHGYLPDINSVDLKEARKAITLKKIQKKYKKYLDGINNPRLSKSDIYEIKQIMQLINHIDLFNIEIGERIIPPGEKDLSEVQLFKVTANQKKFLDLYRDANKIVKDDKNYERRPSRRLNDVINILECLNSNDIFISNNLIKSEADTLRDVIERCPKDIQQDLLEELSDYDEDYPIGKEYNFAKSAFKDKTVWNYFKDADVKKLYNCGLFEEVDENYIKENFDKKKRDQIREKVLLYDFIVCGHDSLQGLNIKTGTYFDENGLTLHDAKHFYERFNILKKIKECLGEEYSFINKSIDEIPNEDALDFLRSHLPIDRYETRTFQNNRYHFIGFNLREEILQLRDYFANKDLKLDEADIIELKELGIIPLKINNYGIEEETDLPIDFFGKRLDKILRHKSNSFERVKDCIYVLEALRKNNIVINNDFILHRDTLEDVVEMCPIDKQQELFEQLSAFDKQYPIGEEFRFVQNAFYYGTKEDWENYKDVDIRELYAYGIIPNNALLEDFIESGPSFFRGLNVKTGRINDEKGITLSDIHSFNNNLSVLSLVQKHIVEGYTLANEDINEIEDLNAIDFVNFYRYDNTRYFSYDERNQISRNITVKEIILQMREYLQKRGPIQDLNTVIEYKKLGVIPLKINNDGIEEDTGLPRTMFGKSTVEFKNMWIHNTERLDRVIRVLKELSDKGIIINNYLIRYDDTLKDIIQKCPKEIQQYLLDSLLDFDEDYPIGIEYNFAKFAYRNLKYWNYFENADVIALNRYGIFEDIADKYLERYVKDPKEIDTLKERVVFFNYIQKGKSSLIGLNINTGTYSDENGKRFDYMKSNVNRIVKSINSLEKMLAFMKEEYTFANESIDEIIDLSPREFIDWFKLEKKDDKNNIYNLPKKNTIRELILELRNFIENNNIRIANQNEIIVFKKLGIIPLRINKDGIDEDTGLQSKCFGKRMKEIKLDDVKYRLSRKLDKLVEILRNTTNVFNICTANTNIDELPDGRFIDFALAYKKAGKPNVIKGVYSNFDLKEEIKEARSFLQRRIDTLTLEEIIEYKKLGILPLNIDENGIDKDTNCPRTEFEFLSLDALQFDKEGYYYVQQPDGTFINSGLKHNPQGFRKNKKHIITNDYYDLRGYNVHRKRIKGDENGRSRYFKEDGTSIVTGEPYDEFGFNAYDLNEDGEDHLGNKPKEIKFAIEYIDGVSHGNLKDVLEKWEKPKANDIFKMLYIASEMCPKIKQQICNKTLKYQKALEERKIELQQINRQIETDEQKLEKLKQELKSLRRKISLLNPMQDFKE